MALTLKMLTTLHALSTFTEKHYCDSKKTVEGLRVRGIVKNVKQFPHAGKKPSGGTYPLYRYSLTKPGLRLTRNIRFLPEEVLKLLSS